MENLSCAENSIKGQRGYKEIESRVIFLTKLMANKARKHACKTFVTVSGHGMIDQVPQHTMKMICMAQE